MLTIFLNGCAAHTYIPGNQFFSPENSGRFLGGDFKGAFGGVTHINVASDITSTSPGTTPEVLKNSTMLFSAQLGLFSAADIYIHSGIDMASVTGLKIQLIGDPQNSAKAGNFSLTLGGGLVGGDRNQIDTVDEVKGKVTFDYSGWEGIVGIGYRPHSELLIYTTPFVTRTNADITVERIVGENATTTATPNGYGEMRGIALGFRIGTVAFLGGEYSFTETTWTRLAPTEIKLDKFSDQAVGVVTGFSW